MNNNEFSSYISPSVIGEFCDTLKRHDAKVKGYYKRTLWDGEVQKGFIVNVNTGYDDNRRKDYFVSTEGELTKGGMKLGKMEVLAEEVLHDTMVHMATETKKCGLAGNIVLNSLMSSEEFEIINEDTDFYDFVKCFCM